MRRLAILVLLLLCASPCFAQLVLTANLAGQVNAPIDQNGWQSFKVTLTQNITFSFVILPLGTPPPAQSTLRVIFVQDATGGRTVTFASNIVNPCTVTGTSSAMTICQFMFDGGTNTWQGISGGAGNPDPPVTQNYSLTTTGVQAAINLTAAPIDTHTLSWRFTNASAITDKVPYTNGDLHTKNASWVYQTGTFNVNTSAIYGSAASSLASRNDGLASGDEYAQATMVETATSATQNGGPCVRVSTVAFTGYCIQAATEILKLVKEVGGVLTTLQDFSATSLAVTGDVLRVEAIGTTINAYKNGVLLGSQTDATITTGSTGLFSAGSANNNGVTGFQSGQVCTVALDSSVDGVTWTAGGLTTQFCSPNANSSVTVTGIANFVRVNTTALSAGTLTAVYSGRLAPAGAGGNTGAVTNGQYVQAGDVIFFQYTSQSIGTVGIHASTRIINPNGTNTVTALDPSCVTAPGGVGFGFVVPSAGWLQSATTYLVTGNFPIGSVYINIYVLNSMPSGSGPTTCAGNLSTSQIGVLLAGAPSGSFYPVSFVGTTSIIQPAWSVPGFTTTQSVTNPAAGADWSFTEPVTSPGVRACIQSVSFQLATSASAANRVPVLRLQFSNGTNTSNLIYPAATAQTATTTQVYSFSPGANAETVTGGTTVYHVVPFNNGQLACFNAGLTTATISTLTTAIQAADQFSNIAILIQLQQDNN